MNLQYFILSISVSLFLVSSKTVYQPKQPVFEGSLSQIIYRNKTNKILTGVINVNEKEVIEIAADSALIQVALTTQDKLKLLSEKKMKNLINLLKNELTVKTKMVFQFKIQKPPRSQLLVKTKSYVTSASIILFVTKSYPNRVKAIVQRLIQLKTKPIFIRYFVADRVRKIHKFRMIRRAIARSNITAKQLAQVLKQKVMGVQNLRYYEYLYPTRNIQINTNDNQYLSRNKVKYQVQVFTSFFIRNLNQNQ